LGPDIGEGLTAAEARQLMIVYSGGFAALFATFMLLHWNALRQREMLRMSAVEVFDARASVQRHSISVSVGVLSVLLAWLLPIEYLAYAGLLFFLMGPAHGTFGYLNGRARERLIAQPSE
jgi:hypothetical protein